MAQMVGGLRRRTVAPARERGLKFLSNADELLTPGRSREGAWIEMDMFDFYWPSFAVAPARERGLKYHEGHIDTKL